MTLLLLSNHASRRQPACAEPRIRCQIRDPGSCGAIAEGLTAKEEFRRQFFEPSWARRQRLIELHERGRSEDDLPSDLLTIMLLHDRITWDSDLPTREAILYLAGATSTTSNAVNHAVAELDRWLDEHPEDRKRLDDRVFLRGVCNEALRLRQNVTALARRARHDITLSTGRVVNAGEHVAVDFIQANQDPDVFGPDAGEFNPRRVVPKGVRPYRLAFGMGRHLCIGLPLVTTISGRLAEEGTRTVPCSKSCVLSWPPASRSTPRIHQSTCQLPNRYSPPYPSSLRRFSDRSGHRRVRRPGGLKRLTFKLLWVLEISKGTIVVDAVVKTSLYRGR